MKILIIAEKPSVGLDIARVLKCNSKGEGYLYNEKYIVSWAVGHLVSLFMPEDYNPKLKQWNFETLPIIPANIKLKAINKTRGQLEIIYSLIKLDSVKELICATDSGREGELIFRYIYEITRCKKPFKRLWISSLTDEAIKNGFANLKDGKEYDNLYYSAKCRSEADWLVGMNASRAFSIRYNANLSIGRVQTPTLAIIVKRHEEIKKFEVKDYYEIEVLFEVNEEVNEEVNKEEVNKEEVNKEEVKDVLKEEVSEDIKNIEKEVSGSMSVGAGNNNKEVKTYKAIYIENTENIENESRIGEGQEGNNKNLEDEKDSNNNKIFDIKKAQDIISNIKNKDGKVKSIVNNTKKQPPPFLYDLTELQRDCNKKYGYSAQETLDIAQDLYEKRKLITYPRTDSRYLSSDMVSKLKGILSSLNTIQEYSVFLKYLLELKKLNITKRIVDNSKITDHHAIIPTNKINSVAGLSGKEYNVYNLIVRRFIAVFYPDYIYNTTRIITEIEVEVEVEEKEVEEVGAFEEEEVEEVGAFEEEERAEEVGAFEEERAEEVGAFEEERAEEVGAFEEERAKEVGAFEEERAKEVRAFEEKEIVLEQYAEETCFQKTKKQSYEFITKGKTITQKGWTELNVLTQKEKEKEKQEKEAKSKKVKSDSKQIINSLETLPNLQKNQIVINRESLLLSKKTKPPIYYNEASLLSAMENAGRFVENEDLKDQLKGSGLGTPATRAAIIEKLINMFYITRKGKSLVPTDKGVSLISILPKELISPETTGKWEKGLTSIAQGNMKKERFMGSINNYVNFLVSDAKSRNIDLKNKLEFNNNRNNSGSNNNKNKLGMCPKCNGDILENSKSFYCSNWRSGCKESYWKDLFKEYNLYLNKDIMQNLLAEKIVNNIKVTDLNNNNNNNIEQSATLSLGDNGKISIKLNN